MRKISFLLTVFIFTVNVLSLSAQDKLKDVPLSTTAITKEQIEKAGQTDISAILGAIPMGKGAETYSYGAGLSLQRNFYRSMIIIDGKRADGGAANNEFVITKEEVEKYGSVGNAFDDIKNIEIVRSGFSAEFGATRLFGKTEKIGTITYEYDGLTILHGFAGYHTMVCDRSDLQFEAGPALGIFPNGSEFGYGAGVNVFYNFTPPAKSIFNIISTGKKKPEASAFAGFNFYKLNEVDPIYTPRFGIRFTF